MSKRLQVLLEDREYRELQGIARRNGMTVSEWVRSALRSAKRTEPTGSVDKKLAAIRAAAHHQFPTADIDQMLAEIEQGYLPSSDG